MSTVIDAVPSQPPVPAWHLLLGWIILLPLLYFATNGNVDLNSGDVSMSVVGSGETSFSHRLALGGTCLLCGVLIFTRFPAVVALGLRAKALLALPVLAILSSIWSQNGRQSMISGTTLLVVTLFALYIGSTFKPGTQFELLMLAGGIALVLSIGLCVAVPSLGAPDHNWRGIFGHKQNCAGVCTLLLVTAIHWRASGFNHKAFRVLCIVMCCAMIVMSQSRTGWGLALVAVCLSASLWLLQRMPAKEALFLSLCLFVVTILVLVTVYINAAHLLSAVGKDVTLSERTVIWAAVWKTIVKQPLLGYGYQAFWTGLKGPSLNIVMISGWALAQSQNGFLDIWLQIGVGGILLLLLATAQAAINAVRVFYSGSEGNYVRWSIVVIVITWLYNVGESSLCAIHLVWFLFLLACIGLNVLAGAKDGRSAADHSRQIICPARKSIGFAEEPMAASR